MLAPSVIEAFAHHENFLYSLCPDNSRIVVEIELLVSVRLTLLFCLLSLVPFLPGGLFLGELTVALLYGS